MLASFKQLFSLALVVTAACSLTAITSVSASFAAALNLVGTCPLRGDSSAIVTAVDERLDIMLADGRMLHLAGVDPPRPTPDRPEGDLQARDWLAGKLRGRTVNFILLAQKPDRWGRIAAVIFDEALDTNHPSLAASLLAAGLARVRPQAEIRPCLKTWLADEATARAAKLGLWGDPYYAILPADEGSAFAEKAATDIIVEGRLADAITSRTGLRLESDPGTAGISRPLFCNAMSGYSSRQV
jgi:endonuclease YncB( thermonuclease family)